MVSKAIFGIALVALFAFASAIPVAKEQTVERIKRCHGDACRKRSVNKEHPVELVERFHVDACKKKRSADNEKPVELIERVKRCH
ncbi:hypothetical protein L596_001406 [Steinernema carpocapsae]|uniref:Saposin B-type domain-containing protein n=1 Tax=Steinernema carpocapsae TaxID=34508 RepID=A0A4U8UL55_STECR|nr:hypothetical protein L596_001406 [Steinernema carpocapsae]